MNIILGIAVVWAALATATIIMLEHARRRPLTALDLELAQAEQDERAAQLEACKRNHPTNHAA